MLAAGQTQGPVQPANPQKAPQQPPEPPPLLRRQRSKMGPASHFLTARVNVDVVATDSDGNYLSNLKKENFRITEDGKPPNHHELSTGDAPITVASWGYSKMGYGWFLYDASDGPMLSFIS